MQNSSKVLQFDDEARAKLLIGVDILADAVKLTMGPRGRNVVIERPNATPILTKDGVTVARSVNLRDKFPNLGVQMIKEAAARTADVAGDGLLQDHLQWILKKGLILQSKLSLNL